MTSREARSEVEASAAGLRLDAWLAGRFTYRSRGGWRQEIQAERITVDGQAAKPSRVLKGGEIVVYTADEEPEPPVSTHTPILYEDARLIALDKPANLPCHPAGRYFKHTLWYLWKDRLDPFRLVHRLDRETSGIVLLAKDAEAAKRLSGAFAHGQARKQYLVAVEGETPDLIEAEGWLSWDLDSPVEKKRRFSRAAPTDLRPDEKAETAVTRFETLARADGMSLLVARPSTGRLHQIRATLCSLGYPVVGDKLYGVDDRHYLRFISDELTAADLAALRLDRQALHAWKLRLPHPDGDGRELAVTAAIPAAIQALAAWPGDFPALT